MKTSVKIEPVDYAVIGLNTSTDPKFIAKQFMTSISNGEVIVNVELMEQWFANVIRNTRDEFYRNSVRHTGTYCDTGMNITIHGLEQGYGGNGTFHLPSNNIIYKSIQDVEILIRPLKDKEC